MRSALTCMSLGHWCSACKGRSNPWWTKVPGGRDRGAWRHRFCSWLSRIARTTFVRSFHFSVLQLLLLPSGNRDFFFYLESARDVVSIPSLLITITGVVCTASRSGEGRGCAPEVEFGINTPQLCCFPLLLARKESPSWRGAKLFLGAEVWVSPAYRGIPSSCPVSQVDPGEPCIC